MSIGDGDFNEIAGRTADMMRGMGAKDAEDVRNKTSLASKQWQYVEMSKVVGDIMNTMYQHDMAYQRNTDLLAQLNEAWNANRYIVNTLDKEQKRVSHLDIQAKRDMYRVRQSYSFARYMNNYYNMTTGVMIFTTIITLILLLPAAMFRQNRMNLKLMVIIDGILLALYLIVLLVLFRNTAVRRENNWDQYHWRPTSAIRSTQANGNYGVVAEEEVEEEEEEEEAEAEAEAGGECKQQ